MREVLDVLHREFVYLWYYFDVQLRQIFGYWVLGILLGSSVSVFLKDKIHGVLRSMSESRMGLWGIVPASLLGIASPLCMYGTIPLLQAWLMDGMSMGSTAAFMITGPSTKITNLGALKIVLGLKHFLLYLAFAMVFSFLTGLAVNLLI